METVVTAAQMRQAEERAVTAGTALAELMQNAGSAAAHVIAEAVRQGGSGARILVLCGPGNNGGDGMVVAERLSEWGYAVAAYTYRRDEPVPDRPLVIKHDHDPDLVALRRLLEDSTVIVDALLGTGRLRPIEGALAVVLDAVAEVASRRAVVALDLPSGVDPDTGAVDPHAVPATITVTFGFVKRGLLLGRGAEVAGHVVTVDIGLPSDAASGVALWRVGVDDVRPRIPKRGRGVNKYSAGAVLIVAGSRRFTGAPQLSALGAARSGAGLVTLATGPSTHAILATRLVEPTFLLLPEDDDGVLEPGAASERICSEAGRYRALLIGPGLARSEKTVALVERILCADELGDDVPLIVDAEGLNALAQIEAWPRRARRRLVLTPHTGEMARLTGLDSADIDANRCDIAADRAREWGAVVVLKGDPTVTAAPGGSSVINSTGGANLASGGTGDVLGGMIASLVAQGADTFDAAVAGVYLHGRAGDVLAEHDGDRGTLAGDLPGMLPALIKSVREGA